jgi:hypothetical protein
MEPHEIQQLITYELSSGEQLLWSGRPGQGLMLRPSDAFMVPFSLFWCGFAIFWEMSAIRDGPVFFKLWGIPFVGVGLYMVVGRFLVDALARRRTVYGLTNERVIILSRFLTPSIKTVSLRRLTDISMTHRQDGTGTITLGSPGPGAWLGNISWPGGSREAAPPALEGISDVRMVYQSIRDAQKAAA